MVVVEWDDGAEPSVVGNGRVEELSGTLASTLVTTSVACVTVSVIHASTSCPFGRVEYWVHAGSDTVVVLVVSSEVMSEAN